MKYQRSAASIALAVFATLGLAGPSAASEQVPFKGRFEATDTAIPIPKTTLVLVTLKATGNATHLGNFTLTTKGTLDTKTSTAAGTFLFTAANGDTVFGTFTAKSKLTSPGVLTVTASFVIKGGTGRFAGATGSFTGTRVKILATGVSTASFAGTISSPGANKK